MLTKTPQEISREYYQFAENFIQTDFEDEICAVLLTGDSFWGFDIVYETEYVPVSVAKESIQ